jgi:hypothetical protein
MDPAHKLGQHPGEERFSPGQRGKAYEHIPAEIAPRDHRSHESHSDTTFEAHYSIGDLANQWRLGRETVRLLVKDEPGVLKIRMGRRKALTRYSVPESVARRVHTKLFNPAA